MDALAPELVFEALETFAGELTGPASDDQPEKPGNTGGGGGSGIGEGGGGTGGEPGGGDGYPRAVQLDNVLNPLLQLPDTAPSAAK